jgi:hypothetical protein
MIFASLSVFGLFNKANSRTSDEVLGTEQSSFHVTVGLSRKD